jgi:hypothetical protein
MTLRAVLRAAAALLITAAAAAAAQPQALPPPEVIGVGNVSIRYWPEQRRLAERIAQVVRTTTLPALPETLLHEGEPIELYIAPDEARFAALTGGLAPHWGAGVAFPALGVIVIPAHRGAGFDNVARTVIHELAHVALHRFLEPARIPRWFTEGYATWASGQLDPEAAWLLRIAFVTRRAPPLDSLALGWPEGVRDARIAYLLSATVLEYLYAQGGEFALRRFLERWSDGRSMEEALFQTYGLTFAQLERHWSRSVRRRYGWAVFFSQTLVIWAILALVVVALFLIRRRRDRRKLARLRADELPDAPAFWVPGHEEPPDAAADDAVPPERAPDPPPGVPPAPGDESPRDGSGSGDEPPRGP